MQVSGPHTPTQKRGHEALKIVGGENKCLQILWYFIFEFKFEIELIAMRGR